MHQVFICHASEEKSLADPIYQSLINSGYRVFYDSASLYASDDFQNKIQNAIKRSDIFVFLLSKNSIKQGKFTLTEVKIAQSKWINPTGRVITINIDNTPLKYAPAYLSSTTLLNVNGDLSAETRIAVDFLSKKLFYKNLLSYLAIFLAVLLAIGVLYYRNTEEKNSPNGFIPPETIRSGDNSAAVVVPADGQTASLLPDKLIIDLQKPTDKLSEIVTTGLSMIVVKNNKNPIESVTNHIRGAIYLSKNASATVTINIAGRIIQTSYEEGNKPNLTLDGDFYVDNDFFRQVTTPVSWNGDTQEQINYPITISIHVKRKTTSDIALISIDSLDAKVQFERR